MYPRFVERRVREAMADMLICGLRQSEKTTA